MRLGALAAASLALLATAVIGAAPQSTPSSRKSGTPAPPARATPPSSKPAGDPPAPLDDEKPIVPPGPDTRRDSRARDQQRAWRTKYGEQRYRYCDDPKHRLVFATCLDETSHKEMEAMLSAQADQQAATLFGAMPEVEVFVAIATPADTRAIFASTPDTAGMYEHPQRRLISSDIGVVLRHEYTHLMHFGHMERLGQPHPMWIQEGLATLYENYDLSADGSIVFQPNPRHNQARALASARNELPFAKLVALNPDDFMARAPSLYPQVRSIFEYMADQGKLRRWYRRLTETFAQDRTGRMALEEVFGKPIDKIETDWRAWVLKRPAVDMTTGRGDRSPGIEVAAATDGVQVTKVQRRSAAQRAGIQVGDVVISIGGTVVRSPREWITAIANLREPAIPVVVRRKSERLELTLRFDDQASAAPDAAARVADGSDGRFPARASTARRARAIEGADLTPKAEAS